MRENICSHESAVSKAARTGLWDSALRDHATSCGACKESVLVAAGMRSLAADLERDSELPDPAWLWRKALLDQKQGETDRALRLYGLPQFVSMLAMILAVAILIAWYSTQLQEYLQAHWQTEAWVRLSQGFWSVATGTAQGSPESFPLVFLLAAAALIAAHPLLVDE